MFYTSVGVRISYWINMTWY